MPSSGATLLVLSCLALIFPEAAWSQKDERCSSTEVRLLERTLDVSKGLTAEKAFRRAEDHQRVHQLIRFHRPLELDQHRALDEDEIDLLEYIENCAYIVALSRSDWEGFTNRHGEIGSLLGPLEPGDKIAIDELDDSDFTSKSGGRKGYLEVLIGFHSDVTDAHVEDLFRSGSKSPGVVRGGPDAPEQHGPRSWSAMIEISRSKNPGKAPKIKTLAEMDSVRRIELGPEESIPLIDNARDVVNAKLVHDIEFARGESTPTIHTGGEGVRIGICDCGIDTSHVSLDSGRVFDSTEVSNDMTHGTWVATIAVGSGEGSEDKMYRGLAPMAKFANYGHFRSRLGLYKQAIVDSSTDVTNHSYVQACDGHYGIETHDIDLIIRGDATSDAVEIPARPQVWAAGNNVPTSKDGDLSGYYSITAPTKNGIVVGSIDTTDKRLSSLSSLGPTWDGRIKPDVVAPGCRDSVHRVGLMAAESGKGDIYNAAGCGTSMAAPVVTGIIALMMEEVRRQDILRMAPRSVLPATYKAILVNTAEDLSNTSSSADREQINPGTGEHTVYHHGPDLATGFGVVDALSATELIKNQNLWTQSSIGSSGESDHWCVSVPPDTAELKVTLAWDDEPGSISQPLVPKLVNDLDLVLVSPTGKKVIHPWTIETLGVVDPASIQPATQDDDHLNNVEQASAKKPEPGIWQVIVSGYFLPFGTSQSYSLAASSEFTTYCPPHGASSDRRSAHSDPSSDFCATYEWLCKESASPPLEITDGMWTVKPEGPVSIAELCSHFEACPTCEGRAWESCPDWSLVLYCLPGSVTALIFDEDGRVLEETDPSCDTSVSQTQRIPIDDVFPGQRRYIAFVGPGGKQLTDEFTVQVRVEPMKTMPRR